MKKPIAAIIKNLSYSVLASGLNAVFSVILTLIIPKLLNVREYAYWQLYVFYLSYVGFFHFGWVDGIYLRFAGKSYEELNKKYFTTQFFLLMLLEIIVCFLIGFYACTAISDTEKRFVLKMVGLSCIIQIPKSMINYLLQITSRIDDYAKNIMYEKLIYSAVVVLVFLLGIKNYKVLLFSDLLAKASTLLFLCQSCRDIVFRRAEEIQTGIKEAGINIKTGSRLLAGNLAGMAIVGIMRFFIEWNWDVDTFGKVSFGITIMNMIMIFVSAVSIVLFPIIKSISEDKMASLYQTLHDITVPLILGGMLFYYPVKDMLNLWLPQYRDSIYYLALLFPICLYETKTTLLISTYLKALRDENKIMFTNLFMAAAALLAAGYTIYYKNNLSLAVVSITALLGVRSVIMELNLAYRINLDIWKHILGESLLVITFICINWNRNGRWKISIYVLLLFLYLIINHKNIKNAINAAKSLLQS